MTHPQINLIIKKLSGELSPSEGYEFDSWINADTDNKLTFEQYEKIWNISGNLNQDYDLDTENEWERLRVKISLGVEPKIISWSVSVYAKIAAALIAITVFGFILKFIFSGNSSHSGNKIEMLAFTTSDSANVFYLPDSSKIVLNTNSEALFAKEFADTARMVYLSGEAYFEVRKSGKPFIVYAGGIQVRVMGTSFNVKAKEEEENVEVVVFEGKVAFSEQNSSPARVINLQADDKIQYNKKEKEYKRGKNKNKNFWWKRFAKNSDIEKELNKAVKKLKKGFRK